MTTTCQQIIDRAKQFSPLNPSLATDPVELLTRIQQMQQRVFTAIASLRRPPFTQLQTLTSSSASSDRTIDLTTTTKPVERLLVVKLASGVEVVPVSEFDIYAQLAPRYIVRGKQLVEVSNDWSATSGAASLNVLYAYGATTITPTGSTSQPVSIPDEWVDLLIKPLAMYFHTKDPGRDPQEYANLQGEYTETWGGFLAYTGNYSGDVTRRDVLPKAPNAGAAQ